MKTKYWTNERLISTITEEIDKMIKSNQIKEIISFSHSSTFELNSVYYSAILIYKPEKIRFENEN